MHGTLLIGYDVEGLIAMLGHFAQFPVQEEVRERWGKPLETQKR